jgi:hypothetical protein
MNYKPVIFLTILLACGCTSQPDPIGNWSGEFVTLKNGTKMSIQIKLDDSGLGSLSFKYHDTGDEDKGSFNYSIRRFKSKNEGVIFLTPTGKDDFGFRFIVFKFNNEVLTLPIGESEVRLIRE